MTILELRSLRTEIPTAQGTLTVVDDVSFTVEAGEIFGLVGESGSGKSMTVRSILGLVAPPGRVTGGEVLFDGQDLVPSAPRHGRHPRPEHRHHRPGCRHRSEPGLPHRPTIAEPMLAHGVVGSRSEARARSIQLMAKVGIPAPEKRIDDYPHQFSGGMCQRVVIASALSCDPRMILADEPTTALDVTIQDQILRLLVALQADLGLSLLLVTHDMGVVAQTCQRVAVMYAGQIVELVRTEDLFSHPRHPYTAGLLSCVPPSTAPPAAWCRSRRAPDLPPCRPAAASTRAAPSPPPPAGARGPPLLEVAPGHYSRCIRHDAREPRFVGEGRCLSRSSRSRACPSTTAAHQGLLSRLAGSPSPRPRGGGRRVLRHPAGRDPQPRRRVGLGQDHARPLPPAPGGADRGPHPL
jgi:ABC-type dipeptide/oligopeptide/nickel transport system ATPase component